MTFILHSFKNYILNKKVYAVSYFVKTEALLCKKLTFLTIPFNIIYRIWILETPRIQFYCSSVY